MIDREWTSGNKQCSGCGRTSERQLKIVVKTMRQVCDKRRDVDVPSCTRPMIGQASMALPRPEHPPSPLPSQ